MPSIFLKALCIFKLLVFGLQCERATQLCEREAWQRYQKSERPTRVPFFGVWGVSETHLAQVLKQFSANFTIAGDSARLDVSLAHHFLRCIIVESALLTNRLNSVLNNNFYALKCVDLSFLTHFCLSKANYSFIIYWWDIFSSNALGGNRLSSKCFKFNEPAF